MAITRLRGNSQVRPGTVNSTNITDRALIPQDFAVWPYVPQNMTTAERDAIQDPALGLTIFNTDSASMEYWNGTEWFPVNLAARLVVDEEGQAVYTVTGDVIYTL